MANLITDCRILCSMILIFLPTFSPTFYGIYLLCGFTDMIDGTIARITNSTSEFGAKLDTCADFIFVVVSVIKFFPQIDFPKWIWIWIVIIALIKIGNFASGFLVQKKFVSEHTIMNKVIGLLLFLFPLTIFWINLNYSCVVVCAIATFAAIQEGYYIRIGRFVT